MTTDRSSVVFVAGGFGEHASALSRALSTRTPGIQVRVVDWRPEGPWPPGDRGELCAVIDADDKDARAAVHAAWRSGRTPIVIAANEATISLLRSSGAGLWCESPLEAAVAVEGLAGNPALRGLLARRGTASGRLRDG